MEKVYTKHDLIKLEDRFENVFSLTYETNEIPDSLMEITNMPYPSIRSQLIAEGYSLIICIPHLPVFKVLKQAELLQENHSFKLLRISPKVYNLAIEDFLKEFEYTYPFYWFEDFREVIFELPKTSQERMKLSNLNKNLLYSFCLEIEECTVAVWKGRID